MRRTFSLLLLFGLLCSPSARGAIIYTSPNTTYVHQFDQLPNTPLNASLGASPIGWVDDSTTPGANQFSIPGFYLYHPVTQSEGGANGHQRMRIGRGSVNTGAFMSFGADGSTDRALGMVSSNTMAAGGMTDNGESYFGTRFTNNTGVTLAEFTVSYTGEQWRDGGAATPNAQQLSFGYMVGATNIQDPGFTAVPALNFVSPVFTNTGGGAAVDGNVAGSVAKGPVTVTGLNWAPGADLWIRWADLNDAGNDHGLAIDDLHFSAKPVPEPGTLALAALAGLAAIDRRRR